MFSWGVSFLRTLRIGFLGAGAGAGDGGGGGGFLLVVMLVGI